MMPRGYWFSSTRTRRWTCGVQAEHHRQVGQQAEGLAWARGTPATHLLLGDAANDVLHGFVWVAGDDTLQADAALLQCLPHTDVQVVVGLLSCQVLWERSLLSASACPHTLLCWHSRGHRVPGMHRADLHWDVHVTAHGVDLHRYRQV